jgi:hypothetical protein
VPQGLLPPVELLLLLVLLLVLLLELLLVLLLFDVVAPLVPFKRSPPP